MLLESHASLKSQQVPLTLLIRGSMGVQLHAKGSDEDGRAKLNFKLAVLSVEQGIDPGVDFRLKCGPVAGACDYWGLVMTGIRL